MNFFENDGMYKVGNVELKFLVDFEKNGDMLIWKTVKHSGFIHTKSIIGAHVFQQAVRIVTPGCTVDINCDGDDTAQKVLSIIVTICVRLYTGDKLGTYNLEKIGDEITKTKGGCCGGCSCGDKNDDEVVKFLDGFFEHMKNKLKENK